MSKQVDPDNLSEDDVEYIRQRPTLRREFMLQGLGDPLSDDYPGLNFTPSTSPEDEDEDDEDDEDEDEDEGGDSEDPDYESWNKDRLKAEIESRNQDRDDDDKIAPASGKNAALAFALREDDKDSSDQ